MGRCAEECAHMVIINSQAEQEFLSPKKDVTYCTGLRKQSSIDIYTWQDGSAPTFINWSSERSYPDYCIFMKSGYWTKFDCDAYWHVCSICEKPQIC
ncbi:unnamed protein product [Rangifer tarandus platyrhynchus]|uniref:Uncharacterized protein n=1 Tax=Rangifer tarandus platyrhynchus TaxID=3082113 RepID=A0AC59ZJ31_RANTA